MDETNRSRKRLGKPIRNLQEPFPSEFRALAFRLVARV